MFDRTIHTLERYQTEAQRFIDLYGATPMDVVAEPDGYDEHVIARARRLDAWDVWLFSDEAQP